MQVKDSILIVFIMVYSLIMSGAIFILSQNLDLVKDSIILDCVGSG